MLSLDKNIIDKLNLLGKNGTPFLVVINYDKSFAQVVENPITGNNNILFSIDSSNNKRSKKIDFDSIIPVDFDEYTKKFHSIISEIQSGNTYLLNLTSPTIVETNYTLKDIYDFSVAKFKLFYENKFVCFSPERFVKILGNQIFTYPMKGTIDASLHNAKEKILQDTKELAEHVMVVDLLRNDLAKVSKNVKVTKFRYIDKIKTNSNELYQVSSEIVGDLHDNWQSNIGNILDSLLPAGSITGTPKKNTIKIIEEIEKYNRDFFCGVFGYFDGKNFDSGVMIRYIQLENGKYVYKSGGGITIDSNVQSEYEEMLSKVYIPC